MPQTTGLGGCTGRAGVRDRCDAGGTQRRGVCLYAWGGFPVASCGGG